MKTILRALFRLMAVLYLIAGIGILFFASFDQLAFTQGIRSRNSGELFVGLVAIFGEPLTRTLIASLFFAAAWLCWPKRHKRGMASQVEVRSRRK